MTVTVGKLYDSGDVIIMDPFRLTVSLARHGKTVAEFNEQDLYTMLVDKALLVGMGLEPGPQEPPGTAPGKTWDWKDF